MDGGRMDERMTDKVCCSVRLKSSRVHYLFRCVCQFVHMCIGVDTREKEWYRWNSVYICTFVAVIAFVDLKVDLFTLGKTTQPVSYSRCRPWSPGSSACPGPSSAPSGRSTSATPCTSPRTRWTEVWNKDRPLGVPNIWSMSCLTYFRSSGFYKNVNN